MVDEIAEDRDLIDLRRAAGVAAFDDLRLERLDDGGLRSLIRHAPYARVEQKRAEVQRESCAEHDLPDELLAVFESEDDHHARDRRHDDEDDVHRLDRAFGKQREVRIKLAAKPCAVRDDFLRAVSGSEADAHRLQEDQGEDGEGEQDSSCPHPFSRLFSALRHRFPSILFAFVYYRLILLLPIDCYYKCVQFEHMNFLPTYSFICRLLPFCFIVFDLFILILFYLFFIAITNVFNLNT